MYKDAIAVGSCKPCAPKKAPVFNIGDYVMDRSGNLLKIDTVSERHGERLYANTSMVHYDIKLDHVRWYSGHDLKKANVKVSK